MRFCHYYNFQRSKAHNFYYFCKCNVVAVYPLLLLYTRKHKIITMKKVYILIALFTLGTNILMAQTIDVVTGLNGEPNRLLLNGSDLYVTEQISNKLIKIDLSSTSPVPVDVITGINDPSSMVLNGNELYIAIVGDNKISKIDISSSTPILVDVVTGLKKPNGLALFGNELYFSESSADRISKIDISNSSPTPNILVTGLNFPSAITLNGNELYISEINGDKISKIDISSDSPTPIDVITGFNGPIGLRINKDTLYVAQKSDNKISKIDISNSSPIPFDVVTGLNGPTDIIFLGNDLYISENGGQKISKLENLILGLDDISIDETILFPNPCTDFIYLYHFSGQAEYNIYSSDGKKQLTGSFHENKKIDVRNLNPGIYILQVDNAFIRQIIKK